MKLKILSDGTTVGTKVVDAETGDMLDHIMRVEWTANGHDGQTRCILTLRNVEVEAVVEDEAVGVVKDRPRRKARCAS